MKSLKTDFLVIGSGIAGMMAAEKLSHLGRVIVATKRQVETSNTNWAQGGISAVMEAPDSFDAHVADTLDAGAGLCREEVVRKIVEGGPQAIADVEAMGASFERSGDDEARYDLGKEGGHTFRRVLHAGDITGHEMISSVIAHVEKNPKITVMEGLMAIDLVTTGWLGTPGDSRCIGAYFLDCDSGAVMAIKAKHTVLASGGAGKTYLYTTNPDVATGDGIAMAWRAGLPIQNMEFVQFHPSCLFHPDAKSFLISEAIRGEGGVLINELGERFVEQSDDRGSLAPRDIVARAIDYEMKSRGEKCVYIDITQTPKKELQKRFPNIYKTCLDLDIDMAEMPIPVVPAAHYCCGGVASDVSGKTDLPGLHAIGEVSCTGLHGANRLASNSLLEGMVMARYLAERMEREYDPDRSDDHVIPDWVLNNAKPSDELVVVEHNWHEVRTCMWDYVGIVRTNKRLDRALRRIQNLRKEIREYYLETHLTADVLELRNIAAVAELIIRSAQKRKESRGLHYSLDYPGLLEPSPETVIHDRPGEHLSVES